MGDDARSFQGDTGVAAHFALVLGLLLAAAVASAAPPTHTVAVESLHVTVLATAGVGDGRRATEVPIGAANDLATDGAGNIYIATALSGRVRKVGPDGVITTVLSTRNSGVDANAARSTTAVAVERSGGRVYVADMVGNRVWMIEGGVTHVLAGTGLEGSRGDGGAAVAAELSLPADVAVGAGGTVYIADMGNHVVRAISSQGIIRTVAGDRPESELDAPLAVTVGADGTVYIADHRGDRVVAVAGDGSVRRFSSPGSCCAVDSLAMKERRCW